jgi:hypothetical protein
VDGVKDSVFLVGSLSMSKVQLQESVCDEVLKSFTGLSCFLGHCIISATTANRMGGTGNDQSGLNVTNSDVD